MAALLATFLSYILLYKYSALFIIAFLGALAPLPSGGALMAAAFFSSQGYIDFYIVLGVGIAGNIAGDNIVYWLVRVYANKIRLIHWMIGTPQFKKIELHVIEHPFLVIFLSRFITAIGVPVNIISGLSSMSFGVYFLFESLGEAAMVIMYAVAGFVFGANWEAINSLSGKFFVALVAGALILYLAVHMAIHNHRNGKKDSMRCIS